MRNKFAAAVIVAISTGAFAASAMADGPKFSSENRIPNAGPGVAVSQYDPAMYGPKLSSETRIPAEHFAPVAAGQPAAARPHQVWQEGYDPHGKWHGHWVVVQ